MKQLLRHEPRQLQVSHQSEILQLRKQIVDMKKQMVQMRETLRLQTARKKKIAVPIDNGVDFIATTDIVYCKAEGNYTTIFLRDRSIIMSKTLKAVEALLSSYEFIRCHQSYLVNVNFIRQFATSNGYQLILADNSRLPVSRRKREKVLNALDS